MRTETCRPAPLDADPREGGDRPAVALSQAVLALWPTLGRDLRAAGLAPVAQGRTRLGERAPDAVVLTGVDVQGDPVCSARRRTAAPAPVVVRVVPAGDPESFSAALDAGAHGVVPTDAPASHVVEVVRAALRGQVLLPVDVLRLWVDRALGPGAAAG